MKGYIYALLDHDGLVRYVGQSINPKQRFEAICDIRKPRSCGPLAKQWVNRHIGRITLQIIECCDNTDEREVFWIHKYRSDHVPLLNIQPGGSYKYADIKSVQRQQKQVREHWKQCDPRSEEEDVRFLDELILQTHHKMRSMRRKHRKQRRRRAKAIAS